MNDERLCALSYQRYLENQIRYALQVRGQPHPADLPRPPGEGLTAPKTRTGPRWGTCCVLARAKSRALGPSAARRGNHLANHRPGARPGDAHPGRRPQPVFSGMEEDEAVGAACVRANAPSGCHRPAPPPPGQGNRADILGRDRLLQGLHLCGAVVPSLSGGRRRPGAPRECPGARSRPPHAPGRSGSSRIRRRVLSNCSAVSPGKPTMMSVFHGAIGRVRRISATTCRKRSTVYPRPSDAARRSSPDCTASSQQGHTLCSAPTAR